MTQNKLIQVTKPSMPSFESYTNEIKSLWDSHFLTNNGVKHKQLTEELKKYLDVENVSMFANGHLALEIALQCLHITGEIITTPFTFISTTNAIIRNGLIPVFCDIDPTTYTIDPKKIENLITEKTSAIVAVHVYGNICNDMAINEIAKKYNLKVIYDAAHAFGTQLNGKSIASLGDISMFSFHATKVFHTVEGGALTYKTENLFKNSESLKNFGIVDSEHILEIGTNAKMSELHAAMGLCNLKNLDKSIKQRKAITEKYMLLLQNISQIILPYIPKKITSNYAYFPVQFLCEKKSLRDFMFQELQKYNIFTRKYFYPLTSQMLPKKSKLIIQPTPIAEKVAQNILCLPIYEDLDLDDVDFICKKIMEVLQK